MVRGSFIRPSVEDYTSVRRKRDHDMVVTQHFSAEHGRLRRCVIPVNKPDPNDVTTRTAS